MNNLSRTESVCEICTRTVSPEMEFCDVRAMNAQTSQKVCNRFSCEDAAPQNLVWSWIYVTRHGFLRSDRFRHRFDGSLKQSHLGSSNNVLQIRKTLNDFFWRYLLFIIDVGNLSF